MWRLARVDFSLHHLALHPLELRRTTNEVWFIELYPILFPARPTLQASTSCPSLFFFLSTDPLFPPLHSAISEANWLSLTFVFLIFSSVDQRMRPKEILAYALRMNCISCRLDRHDQVCALSTEQYTLKIRVDKFICKEDSDLSENPPSGKARTNVLFCIAALSAQRFKEGGQFARWAIRVE